jgi:hypothetical protein
LEANQHPDAQWPVGVADLISLKYAFGAGVDSTVSIAASPCCLRPGWRVPTTTGDEQP